MPPLEQLLQQCTAKITVPGGWGTGFFVAPGLILTCAHVVQRSPTQVQVEWQNKTLDVVVEHALPDPYDVALLRVTLPTDVNPPCVWLEEEVRSRDPLYLFGYPDEGDRQGEPRTFNCVNPTGSGWILFNSEQVRPGMSGSPLLNQRTGKVCGMVKFTRDRSSDLGGGAIPTRVLLEQFPELRELQRGFHEQDRRWVNLTTTQSGIDFQPYLQAILADEDYREWQEVYTPTTVEDRRRMPAQDTATVSQRRFSSRLKLRAETVKPDKQEQEAQDKTQEPPGRVEQWDVLAGLRKYANEHMVLIGKPGSGKSTSLERLLWEDAEKALQDPNARIPVLVKLRRCTGTIEALIRDFLLGHQVALELVQIEELLRQGKFLLLLDGLNELPKDFEIEVVNFRDRYHRTTPMIVSTRDLGGGGTLGIEKTLKMLPLTESQMREFVRGYLGEEGDRLFQQLQGDRLRKFAETPLLLWMLCRVFAQNGKVPDNLGLAFREFAQLHDQELQVDAPTDSKDQWRKLLRHLAFVMMQGKSFIDPELSIPREEAEDCLTAYLRQEDRANPRECAEQWLKDLLKYHLIQPVIQPNFEEHIEFRHQLIQEYYAAEYLLKLLPNLTDNQLKRDYLNYLKWTEPLALMLALLEEEAQAMRVVKLALTVDWQLGARLAGEVKPEFQAQSVKSLDELDAPDWLKARLLEKIAPSDTTISDRSVSRLLEQFQLLELLADSNIDVRWSAVNTVLEIQFVYIVDHFIGLQNELDWDTRNRLDQILNKVRSEHTIFSLLELMENPDIDVSNIEDFDEDLDYEARWRVIFLLGEIRSECAVPSLLKLLNDYRKMLLQDSDGWGYVHDRYYLLCGTVIRALGKSGSELAVPDLLNILENYDDFRSDVVEALRKIGSELAVPGLLKLLERTGLLKLLESKSFRWSRFGRYQHVIEALVEIGSEIAIPYLIKLLETSDCWVRYFAVKMLEKIGSEIAIPDLLKQLDDADENVRECASLALGEIGSEAAIPGLLQRLGDTDKNVRWSATLALGKIGSEAVIPNLLESLDGTRGNELWRITDALSKIAKKHADVLGYHLPHLLTLIPTDSGEVVHRVILSIQENCKYYNYEIWQAHLAGQKSNTPAS